MSQAQPSEVIFRVGDQVIVPWQKPIVGEVIEDRGTIGHRGRHHYTVRIPMDPDEPTIIQVAGDYLRPAPAADKKVPVAARIVAYLSDGGLISILRSNTGGGASPPRVWLRSNGPEDLVHTYEPSRGVIGGQIVPFNALHGPDRIFAPKVDEVASFLRSFGLDEVQADEVIRAVGTAP